MEWNMGVKYNFTNPVGQSPSWEANSHSASQEIPHFYGTQRFVSMFKTAYQWSLSWAKYF